MRVRSLATIVVVSILAAGCSKGSDSNSASAAAAASPAASLGPTVRDKRTGLPIYPGARQSSTSTSNGNTMTSFFTTDSAQSVAAFYKAALPTSFTAGDQSSNGTLEFDKKSGDQTTQSVSISTSGSQTYIDLETFK